MNRDTEILIIMLAALLIAPFTTFPSSMNEKEYVIQHCSGQVEQVLSDKTRVDCLTDDYAVEYDYDHNWAEAVGQSLHYAAMTGKRPAVVLITTPEREAKYVGRVRQISEMYCLKIEIETVYAR